MASTEVVRVDSDVVDKARDAAPRMGRSTGAQVAFWARLGLALEQSRIPSASIQGVLRGDVAFDDLSAAEQQAVTEVWASVMDEAIADLDLEAEFTATGVAHAELDDSGNVVAIERR